MNWLKALVISAFLAAPLWAAEPVNVNTATAEQIAEALSGVGMSKAQAIIEYREAHGAFKHPDELVNVKGIGLKTIDRNRGLIHVGNEKPAVTSPTR